MNWIVVNVGCIECGVSSNIVGMFTSQERADEVAAECARKHAWREGGQNNFDVFPMPPPDQVADEYA